MASFCEVSPAVYLFFAILSNTNGLTFSLNWWLSISLYCYSSALLQVTAYDGEECSPVVVDIFGDCRDREYLRCWIHYFEVGEGVAISILVLYHQAPCSYLSSPQIEEAVEAAVISCQVLALNVITNPGQVGPHTGLEV